MDRGLFVIIGPILFLIAGPSDAALVGDGHRRVQDDRRFADQCFRAAARMDRRQLHRDPHRVTAFGRCSETSAIIALVAPF